MPNVLAHDVAKNPRIVLRFGLVGIGATAIHMVVSLAAQHVLQHPFISNLCGFLTAFVFSFLGHSLWTFKTNPRATIAGIRFFVVAASSFVFSNVVLAGLVSSGAIRAEIALALSIAVIPIYNYILARYWAFGRSHDQVR